MRSTCIALLLVASSLSAAPALAAPTQKERAEAKRLVIEAQKELKAGNAGKAAELFGKANALDAQPSVELDQAKALVQAKRLVAAAKLLDRIAAQARAPGQKKLRDGAMALRTEIEPRIPKLTIKLAGDGAAGAKVTVDDEKVDVSGPIELDPGEHELAARAGGVSTKRDVTLAEGATETVTLTLQGAAEGAKKDDKDGGGGPAIIPASIAFGVGAVGLGVGIAFGVLAFDEANKVKAACPEGTLCPADPDLLAARDTSLANGWASTIGFIVGGAGVATGAIILIATSFGGSKGQKKEAKPFVLPYAGPRELGVVGRF